MNREITISFLSLVILATLPLINNPVYAGETLKDILTKRYQEEKDICAVVKEAIRKGINAKEVTKICIEMGHNACLVVRCAVEGKGNLEQIIIGALEAGATPDVFSRCTLDAGAEAREIARILEPELSPAEIGLAGGSSGGGLISPSSF